MKIGILTFHNAKNYGATLQAYALRKILETNLKEDAYIIDYEPEVIEKTFHIFQHQNWKTLLKSILLAPMTIKKYNRFKTFSRQYHHLSQKQYHQEVELGELPKEYQAFITGSDQVWNTRVTEGLLDSYTLNFVTEPNIKKISYAASIGNSTIEEEYRQCYQEKLDKLDYISVREETAKMVLEKILQKPIEVVLDPTLLLQQKEWNEIAIDPKKNNKYILVYCLEENKELNAMVSYMAHKLKLDIVTLAIKNKYGSNTSCAYTSGPREFIGLFKNAEYVVTNSFHGTTFSIIYHKKFYTVPHSNRGSRMIDLLNKLELNHRIVHTASELQKKELEEEIDYSKVDEIVENKRKGSIDFLKNALGKEE